MSGGHFNYDQNRIGGIAEAVECLIENNDIDDLNEWGDHIGRGYAHEVIAKFQEGLAYLRIAEIYAQRIDWLVSGDDREDSFLRRLQSDLHKLDLSKGSM